MFLQNDVNTKGNTQWFNFNVYNTKANSTVKFNIINFIKKDSLFNYGMLPAVYSYKNQKKENIGWHRDGVNVSYNKGNLTK